MSLLHGTGLTRRVLRGVDLDVAAGERVGLLGASGAGKTTLVRALLALEPLEAGGITCDGRAVRRAPARRLRWYRRLVQHVPQDPATTLDPRVAVRDLVRLPVRRLGTAQERRCAHDLVEAALDAVGLPADRRDARPRELSGGQAQRVALARALVLRPRLLLADEPVSGLDLPLRALVLDTLRTVSQQHGTALLLVSHDVAAVAALCERTLVLDDGRVVEDRPTHELLTDPHHPVTRALAAAVPVLP
ncbi:ATP-binding cassette domain-containing protein, partial [Kineococcus siccus]|uniref:ATP-binding cassette domain-containing protein n=1 Tax=Kineococcus siccus TaxID=2696567 RepID=UPI001411D51F